MLRLASLILTVLTGASALVYEVAWQKYLATLLGSHGEATAAVLAIFLGGLAGGYALFARLAARTARRHGADQPPHLLRLYGAVELAIGAHALLFPILYGVAQALSLWVPRGHAAPAFAFDVALSALLIGPPAVHCVIPCHQPYSTPAWNTPITPEIAIASAARAVRIRARAGRAKAPAARRTATPCGQRCQ